MVILKGIRHSPKPDFVEERRLAVRDTVALRKSALAPARARACNVCVLARARDHYIVRSRSACMQRRTPAGRPARPPLSAACRPACPPDRRLHACARVMQ